MAVLGLNSNGASKILTCIDDFSKELTSQATLPNTFTTALKGTNIEKQFTEMLKNYNDQMTALIKNLTDLKTQMNTIIQNYKSNDSSSTAISTASKKIKS